MLTPKRYDLAEHQRIASLLSALLRVPPRAQPGLDGPITVLRTVLGSGFLDMNPTYVIAVLDPIPVTIGVAAHAKKGLINQHSAEKAVRRILSQLRSAR